MRRAVLDSDDDRRAPAWSGLLLLLLLVVAEVPRVEDPILAAPTGDGATKASVVLGRVASWRAAAVRNEAALRLRRGAGAAIVVLVLSINGSSAGARTLHQQNFCGRQMATMANEEIESVLIKLSCASSGPRVPAVQHTRPRV